jgi:hypothetical protein
MKFFGWDELGIDARRMAAIVAAVSLLTGSIVALVAHPILGDLGVLLAVVAALGSAYSVAALPRRSREWSSVQQAREVPALAAAAAVYLQSSGSKCKTLLMLRSDEPRLAGALAELRRTTLLGIDPGESYSRLGGRVESESASKVLASVIRSQTDKLSDEGEELEGMVNASLAKEDTKFPVFLTICFFIPIMLMLLAAIEHHTDPLSMLSLTFLEVVVLDLSLVLASTERGRLAA